MLPAESGGRSDLKFHDTRVDICDNSPRKVGFNGRIPWRCVGSQYRCGASLASRGPSAAQRKPRRGEPEGHVDMEPGGDLLSHRTLHYHRRKAVSLPRSGWDRVVPARCGHQANWLRTRLRVFLRKGFGIVRCGLLAQRFGCYMVKSHGQLVSVSFTHYCASTPDLSTWWSSRTLQGDQVPGEISSWEGLPA